MLESYAFDTSLVSQTPLYSIFQAIAVILCVIFIIWNIKMAFEDID